jgi:hypothetical protein
MSAAQQVPFDIPMQDPTVTTVPEGAIRERAYELYGIGTACRDPCTARISHPSRIAGIAFRFDSADASRTLTSPLRGTHASL